MFLEYMIYAGGLAWFFIYIGIMIIPIGLFSVFFYKNQKTNYLLFYISLFTLLLGIIGSILSYREISLNLVNDPNFYSGSYSDIEKMKTYPFLFGLFVSIPISVFSLISISRNKRYYKNHMEKSQVKTNILLFFKRFLAYLIDYFIIYIISFTIIVLLQSVITNSLYIDLFIFTTIIIISWLYFSLFESSSMQTTIGKKLFKLVVIDINGNRINFKRASVRLFGKYLSFITFGGCFVALLTRENQALHDIIAKCVVTPSNIHSTGREELEA